MLNRLGLEGKANLNLTTASIRFLYYIMTDTIATALAYAQCVPGFSNPNQKDHRLFQFYIAGIYKTDQNQLKKPSVTRFPKFTSIDMAEKCHQCLSFKIENPFFEDYCFGSLMTDGFFN